jgi:rare lipoprotein A
MANGDRFNRHKFTAASLWLPLGSRIRVICPTTGKSVDVTVTDRGPHKRGRILDLAEAPARALGMVKEGTITVFFYILPETVLAD